MHEQLKKYGPLIARILIAPLFIMSGAGKFMDIAGTVGYMTNAGIPAAGVLVYFAAVLELLGGLAILIGFKTKIAAKLLFLFLLVVSVLFHRNFSDQMQLMSFLKNMTIMGGLLMLKLNGAGPVSIDAQKNAHLTESNLTKTATQLK